MVDLIKNMKNYSNSKSPTVKAKKICIHNFSKMMGEIITDGVISLTLMTHIVRNGKFRLKLKKIFNIIPRFRIILPTSHISLIIITLTIIPTTKIIIVTKISKAIILIIILKIPLIWLNLLCKCLNLNPKL